VARDAKIREVEADRDVDMVVSFLDLANEAIASPRSLGVLGTVRVLRMKYFCLPLEGSRWTGTDPEGRRRAVYFVRSTRVRPREARIRS
jgi:hypothetical protein